MKKVLALVLAVLMLATVAFADGAGVPGDSSLGGGGFDINPGDKLKFGEGDITGTSNTGAVNSTNYTIGKITYSEGKNLVESIKFNDTDDRLVIALKKDYGMDKAKSLKLKVELKGKKIDRNPRFDDVTVFVANFGSSPVNDTTYSSAASLAVGYPTTTVIIDSNYEIASLNQVVSGGTTYDVAGSRINTLNPADDMIYKFKTGKDDPTTSGTDEAGKTYATVNLASADPDVESEFKVYDGDKAYFASNTNPTDAQKELMKKYADKDAEMDFLNYDGEPTLSSTVTQRIYKPEGTHVYLLKDGKISKEIKWNDDEGCFVEKTRTLGSYVFSDKPLSVSETTPADENPDTGANDVVGIATALAAVALVSAAAVSLKK